MANIGKVKKHEVALFLNTGTKGAAKYIRIAKAKDITLSFEPKTEEYDYIADENPTTDLEMYAPKITGLPLTMYREEADFKAIWDYAYNLKTGGEANTDMILVFKFDIDAKASGKFRAWKSDCTVIVKDVKPIEGTIEFDLAFRGSIIKGHSEVGEAGPVFTEQAGGRE